MSMIQSTINGISFESLGAMLLEYEVGPCDYTGGYVVPSQSMIPVKLKHRLGTRKVKLKIDFVGSSLTDVTNKVSAFVKLLHECADIYLPDGYYYKCYYSNSSSPQEQAPWIHQVDFTLEGYKHGALKTIQEQGSDILTFSSAPSSKTVQVAGDVDTPIIFSIYCSTQWCIVNGIKTDQYAKQKWIVIDGYKKTVTYTNGGVVNNYFNHVELEKFPLLKVGNNTITYSDSYNTSSSVKIKIQYYPLYL